MMKKLQVLVVVLLMLVLVGGCSQSGQNEPVTPVAQAVPVDKDAIVYDAVEGFFKALGTKEGVLGNNLIEADQLYAELSQDPGAYFVVDIRGADDFKAGHIEADSIINLPFREVGDNLHLLPKDRTIVVTCYTGQTAGQTIAALRIAGYDAISLRNGMVNGWLKNELPVTN